MSKINVTVERKLKRPFLPFTIKIELEVDDFETAQMYAKEEDDVYDDLILDIQDAIVDELLSQGLVPDRGKRKSKNDGSNC